MVTYLRKRIGWGALASLLLVTAAASSTPGPAATLLAGVPAGERRAEPPGPSQAAALESWLQRVDAGPGGQGPACPATCAEGREVLEAVCVESIQGSARRSLAVCLARVTGVIEQCAVSCRAP